MRTILRDLQPSTNYSVQVRAVSIDGTVSEWSRKFPFRTMDDPYKPAVPANLTFVNVGTSFHGEWDAVTKNDIGLSDNIARYDVELTAGTKTKILSVPQKTDGTKVTFDLTFDQNKALFGTPQPSISMRVRAVNAREVAGDYTAPVVATNPPPGPVTELTPTAGVNLVTLNWKAPVDDDVIGYNIYVGTTSGFVTTAANRVTKSPLASTSYSLSIATYSTLYFRVESIDVFNQASTQVEASAKPVSPFEIDTTPPAAPVISSATMSLGPKNATATLTVNWPAVTDTDLAGYKIRYRKKGDTDWSTADAAFDETKVVIPGLVSYQDYEVQARAYDWSTNYSAWSALVTANANAKTAPAKITGVTASAGKDSIQYTWTAAPEDDVVRYEITFSTSATFASGNIIFNTSGPSLTVSGLTPGTTYYVRVRAVNFGGTAGTWSDTNTTTTGTFATVTPTDGYAPSASPTPTVRGGLAALYVSWSPVLTNSNGGTQKDTVTYEVHLSATTGFTPSSATKVTEVDGLFAVIDVLPGTSTKLSYGTTYYVKLIAKDGDGPASAGTQGSGQISKVASTDVQSIGADLIVPGTGIVNNLVINSGGSIQSSNYNASAKTGYKIDNTGIDIQSGSVRASALIGDTLGSSTGTINIAAGASIVLSGGAIKSNDYSGSFNATTGTGWSIGNGSLVVNQGSISANALVAGTISGTNTITLSGANAKIVGTGFSLSGSGLTVTQGSIEAQALNIQMGKNLLPPQYADFEFPTDYYTSNLVVGKDASSAGSFAVVAGTSKFGGQSLKISATTITPSTGYYEIHLSDKATGGENIDIDENKKYIFSFYVMTPSGSGTKTVRAVVQEIGYSGGIYIPGSFNVTADGTWQRVSFVYTPRAGVSKASFRVRTLTVGDIYVDGVQLEEQIAASTAPSGWSAPGSTTIDGNMIRTGSIRSTAPAVGFPDKPAWSINTSGAAQFGDASVRGVLVVGSATGEAESFVQSGNYVPGSTGWILRGDGTGELRGLAADSIDGTAIKAGTLTADKVQSGTLTADVIISTGSITAGDPSEGQVVIDSTGFTVTGKPSGSGTVSPLVVFPTNSAAPNIISGTLSSDTVNIENTMNVNPNATIELLGGSKIVMQTSVQPPKSTPTVDFVYDSVTFDGSGFTAVSDQKIYGVCAGPDGSIYTVHKKVLGSGKVQWLIVKWTAAGSYVGTAFIGPNTQFPSASQFGGMVYHATTNRFYILMDTAAAWGADRWQILMMNNPMTGDCWETFGDGPLAGERALHPNRYDSFPGTPSLGTNASNSQVLLLTKNSDSANWIVYNYNVALDPVSEMYKFTQAASMSLSGTSSITGAGPILRGTFDYGADKYVWFVRQDGAINEVWTFDSGTGALQSGYTWTTPYSQTGHGLLWDSTASKFKMLTDASNSKKYYYGLYTLEGGDAFWSGDRNEYIAYTWSDTNAVGGTHETVIGPIRTVARGKSSRRAKIRVTVPTIPVGGSDDPNQARIYRGLSGTAASMYYKAAVNTPNRSVTLDPYAANGVSAATRAYAAFPAGTGIASLRSDDGVMYLKADGALRITDMSIDTAKPTIRFHNNLVAAGASGSNYWIRADGGNLYFLQDKNDDGAWESQWPLWITTGGNLNSDYEGNGITQIPRASQFATGTVTATVTSSASGAVTWNYGKTFSSTPKVVATVNGGKTLYYCVVSSRSSTSCTITVIHRDGATVASDSVLVDCIAMNV